MPENLLNIEKSNAKIVQFSDDTRTLPDGSKVIYAENKEKIALYHKIPFERGNTYVYQRNNGKITVNGKPGENKDKRKMINLGTYFIKNAPEDALITIDVQTKGNK
jgi:hypothetical protein